MKKVSVIIPIYNTEEYLPKCLDSVIGQSYENLEIICIDDGSPDGSVKIVRDYAENDERIQLISQKNQGLSGARNTGIKNSCGDFIVFLDSDDWMDVHAIGAAVNAAEKNGSDTVLWGYVREFPEKSVEKKIFNGDRVFDAQQTSDLIHRRMAGLLGDELKNPENADSIVTAWGKLYDASIIRDNGLFFTDTAVIGTEDALFNLNYFGFSHGCTFLDRPYNHYRKDNEVSLTRSYKPLLPKQWATLYGMMAEYIEKNSLPASFSAALKNRICLSMIGLGLNELCDNRGHLSRIKNLKAVLSSELYRDAFAALSLSQFPLHWKLFFLCCKLRFSSGLYLLINAIQYLISK